MNIQPKVENKRVLLMQPGTIPPLPVIIKKSDANELLVITSFPPRECGIATYSQDLIAAINKSFKRSFKPVICALENSSENFSYPAEVNLTMNTQHETEYKKIINFINESNSIKAVLIQHEFGLFEQPGSTTHFLDFLGKINKPSAIVFHTVLPNPGNAMKEYVESMVELTNAVIVMTKNASEVLGKHYNIDVNKVKVIAHGTHLVKHEDKKVLKKKYDLTGRRVLTTFGLLSSGKGIETTLNALPAIVKKFPKTMFLVLGKTHPGVVKNEGEKYRESLHELIEEYGLQNNVRFVNQYLSLDELLEYLQLTDIYLFTSKDPQQAVSGTFAYAMSCACAIVSTPIPHAKELIQGNAGLLFDFEDYQQLSERVITLLGDDKLRKDMSLNALHAISETSWENSAVSHVNLFKEILGNSVKLKYEVPEINLEHMNRLTDSFGLVQFSKINNPDLGSGYTVDDNARALIAFLTYYSLTGDKKETKNIKKYINLLIHCQQSDGRFLNYVNSEKEFTEQNYIENLDDANGRALWAIGYAISMEKLLPATVVRALEKTFVDALFNFSKVVSPRATAFAIKGMYYYLQVRINREVHELLNKFADGLADKFRNESSGNWHWFESYLTYANSLLPEALLLASKIMKNQYHQNAAVNAFNFLLSQTFNGDQIEVISNKSWQHKDRIKERYGEQPIEIGYTIMALGAFYDSFNKDEYKEKMLVAFSWFLGNNHLKQTIYNSVTGGCFDGLEQNHVNLNQGAESTICYLLARLTVEKYARNSYLDNSELLIQKLLEEDLRTAS